MTDEQGTKEPDQGSEDQLFDIPMSKNTVGFVIGEMKAGIDSLETNLADLKHDLVASMMKCGNCGAGQLEQPLRYASLV